MKQKNILSMSDKGTQEYCCNIIRIGEVFPIEGSDFLGKTYINGDSIVVRKDQVQEGQIYFYASNETELAEKFLSANNLFSSDDWEKNSNADTVRPIKKKIEEYKSEISAYKKRVKDLMKVRRSLETQNENMKEKEFAKARNILKHHGTFDMSNLDALKMRVIEMIKEHQEIISDFEQKLAAARDSIKKYVGFFNKYGRVKCLKLRGIPSYGFIFGIDELTRAYPEMEGYNMEENVGMDFDTIGDELFIKAYVPRIKPKKERMDRSDKTAKKAEKKISRLVPGEFVFHYDTNPLGKNMDKFEPNHNILISNKLHGTSGIFSNCKIKYPINLPFYKKWINAIVHVFNKDKEVFPTFYIDYGDLYSSRRIIKNQDINPNVGAGFYSQDVWGFWAERLKGKIPKGMTVYAEIVGYEPGCEDKYIQKQYDYGCEPGKNKLMPYRITEMNEDGIRKEWNVEDVYNWTVDLMNNCPDIAEDIMPIDILYHGKIKDLYPDISTKDITKWRNDVLLRMSLDIELFGMEQDEPLCKNIVPREGLVIRKDDDEYPEAWKLKTTSFREWERGQIDSGDVDMEIMERYEDEE